MIRARYFNLLLIIAAMVAMGQLCAPPVTTPPPVDNTPPPPPVLTSCGLLGNNCSFGTGGFPSSLALADFDNDTDLDMAVANFGLDSATLFTNDGTGNFTKGASIAVGDNPSSIFAADLDGDGDIDLAVASVFNVVGPAVVVFKNNGSGTFGSAAAFGVGGVPTFVTGADLDLDGDIDLVTANSVTNNVTVLSNAGNGTFAISTDLDVGEGPVSVAIADLDLDGDLDLAVANRDDDTVSILRRQLGMYLGAVNFPAGVRPQFVIAGRFDADLDFDLAIANSGPNDASITSDNISVLPNNGNASFAAPLNFVSGVNPQFIATGDFDADGDLDLAVANFGAGPGTSNVAILKNNGFGIFGLPTPSQVGDGPQSIATGDLDDDGDIDMVVANFISSGVTTLGNNGQGVFARGGN